MEDKDNKDKKDATPERTLEIEYKGTTHELKFPNTGKLMALAIFKAKLSDNEYNEISSTPLLGDKLAQFSIDTITHVTILCPDLIKGLNIKEYSDMEIVDMKVLIKIYIGKILPWMNSWYNFLNDIDAD